MDTKLCRMLGIEFPLVAFSHCRDVVTSVSRSGGFGVFGAAGTTPEQLETELAWINRAAEAGNSNARELVSYFVGQGVGLVDSVPNCRQVVAAFMTEFAEALEDMRRLTETGG